MKNYAILFFCLFQFSLTGQNEICWGCSSSSDSVGQNLTQWREFLTNSESDDNTSGTYHLGDVAVGDTLTRFNDNLSVVNAAQQSVIGLYNENNTSNFPFLRMIVNDDTAPIPQWASRSVIESGTNGGLTFSALAGEIDFSIGTGRNTAMRLNSNEQMIVGLGGLTNPLAKLHVSNLGGSTVPKVFYVSGGSGEGLFDVRATGELFAEQYVGANFVSATSAGHHILMTDDLDGSFVRITPTNLGVPSMRKWKKNFQKADDSILNWLKKADVSYYEYIVEDEDEKEVIRKAGVMADSFQKLGLGESEEIVSFSDAIGVLYMIVQEQQKLIEELQVKMKE